MGKYSSLESQSAIKCSYCKKVFAAGEKVWKLKSGDVICATCEGKKEKSGKNMLLSIVSLFACFFIILIACFGPWFSGTITHALLLSWLGRLLCGITVIISIWAFVMKKQKVAICLLVCTFMIMLVTLIYLNFTIGSKGITLGKGLQAISTAPEKERKEIQATIEKRDKALKEAVGWGFYLATVGLFGSGVAMIIIFALRADLQDIMDGKITG